MSILSTRPAAWRFSRSATDTADPGVLRQRARTFASSAANVRGGSTLLVVARDDRTVDRYLVASEKGGADAAKRAAAVVGANVSQCEDLPDIDTTNVVIATAKRGSMSANETQSGSDISVVAETFISSARPGDWIAVRLRAASNRQVKANRDWRQGVGTHHSLEGEAMIATITAGGRDRVGVERVLHQVIAAMPGFDVQIKTHHFGLGPLSIGSGILGALTFGAGLYLGEAEIASALALAPSMLFAQGALGTGFSERGRIAGQIARGIFPTATSRAQRSRTNRNTGEVTKVDYPLDRRGFLLGPDVAIGLLTSDASGSTDAATTSHRQFPPALTQRIGPLFARSADGSTEACLDVGDLFGGIAAVGRPGSGKSVFVRTVFGWVIADKVRVTGLAGATGANTSIVVFENKGEGADYYEAWAQMAGTSTLRMDVADATTPAIDMFAGSGTESERASLFVEAMRYAFPEGSIESRSLESLRAIFAASLWLTENGGAKLPSLEGATIIRIAHTMLGGNGDENALALAAQVRERAGVHHPVWLGLGPLFGATTPAQRRTLSEAPRNKVDQMFGIEMWFDASRPKRSWSQLIGSHETLVLNLGTSANGSHVSEAQEQLISSMLVYLMQSAVRSTCDQWFANGKSLYIFADELSSLAGNSPEIIDWLREKGRTYGVRNVFATQRLEQLHPVLRDSLAGYSTMAWFAQSKPEIANSAAVDLSLGGSEWSPSDVVNLPNYVCAMRTTAGGQRQVAFTAPIVYYESKLHETWDAQRWLSDIGLSTNTVRDEHPDRSWTSRTSESAPDDDIDSDSENDDNEVVDFDDFDDAPPADAVSLDKDTAGAKVADPSDPSRFDF